MKLRQVLRRTCKWGATAIAIAVAVAWAYSRFRGPSLIIGNDFLGLVNGGVLWERLPSASLTSRRASRSANTLMGLSMAPRDSEEINAVIQVERLRSRGCCWRVSIGSTSGVIGLWPFLLAPGLVAGLLWRTDLRNVLRKRVGHCPHCGYDCRGLATPTTSCPECGTVPPK